MAIYLGSIPINESRLGSIIVTDFQQAFDSDAQAFINATGISGNNAIAINNLVVSLKSNDLWNGFDAIYPMVGGTSTTCKFNLKNAQDTNAAYRLNFVGGWTFDSTGALPNGSTAYADTFYNLQTNLTTSNGSLSYYSITNNTTSAGDIGANSGGNRDSFIRCYGPGGRAYFPWGGGDPNVGGFSTQGFFITNAITSTTVDGWRNGTRIVTNGTTANNGLPNFNVYIGAINFDGTAGDFTNRGCSFATIGDSIASGKETTFSTIVNNFQIGLGRYSY